MTSRPKIAIAGHRAESTSASRRSALISSERLVEAVWQAGGDPLVYLPVVDSDYAQRLSGISGILVPGGGDVDPSFYGQEPTTDAIYGVDKVSDAFDLGLIRYAIDNAIPLLAICRGAQLVNVACGGICNFLTPTSCT
jgi:putative glutamine amidotransferase